MEKGKKGKMLILLFIILEISWIQDLIKSENLTFTHVVFLLVFLKLLDVIYIINIVQLWLLQPLVIMTLLWSLLPSEILTLELRRHQRVIIKEVVLRVFLLGLL
jgi:hypothetical protein